MDEQQLKTESKTFWFGKTEHKVERRQTSHDRVSHSRRGEKNNAKNKNVSERVTGGRHRKKLARINNV